MYCCHCGCRIPDDSAFCPQCGKPLNQPGGANERSGAKARTKTQQTRTEPKSPTTRGGIPKPLAAVVCVLALILAGRSAWNLIAPPRYDPQASMERFRANMIAAGLQESSSDGESSSRGEPSAPDPASSSRPSQPAKSFGSAKTPAKSDLTVPDLGIFLGCSQDTEAGGYSFSVDDVKGPAAVKEFRKLLESWNFRETYVGKEEYAKNNIDRFNQYTYYYNYTGTGKVTGEIDWYPDKGQKSDIYLAITHYVYEDRYLIGLGKKDCFTPVDPGVTASDPPDDRNGAPGGGSGGGGSGSSEDDESWKPEKVKIRCGRCFGEGTIECDLCKGRGGKYVTDNSIPNYAGSTGGPRVASTWERCRKCDGDGSITCPRCHGDKVQ